MLKLGVFASDPYLSRPHLYEPVAADYELDIAPDWKTWSPERLLARCRGVDVILTGRGSPRLPDALVEDRGRLKYLLHLHGTIRHLVSRRHIEAGLVVTNWGDEIAGVAEGALALLLCQLKQIVTLNAFAKGGPDERIYQAFPATLSGRDVGLYGFGPIGRHMARMLEPLGARLAIYDPYASDVPPHIRRCESLRELFATCQAVSIHCGLNDQTRHSVTAELLALLPQGGIVVNTARGAIVDERALAEAVRSGRIVAGIDVIEDERNWPASPLAPLKIGRAHV